MIFAIVTRGVFAFELRFAVAAYSIRNDHALTQRTRFSKRIFKSNAPVDCSTGALFSVTSRGRDQKATVTPVSQVLSIA
jgi:hypothetical protein